MIVRAPHLQDERLFDCYYAERRGDAPDPPSAEHLADCEACARRYAELGTFLTTLSTDADADINAMFPPERLHAQQQDIARRIELVGRAPRVISFPGRFAAQKPQASTTRRVTRWVAVAAAAGVFVGVAAGTMFNFGDRFDLTRTGRRGGTNVAERQVIGAALPARLAAVGVASASDTDDTFMSDLESALDRPHTSELIAFDALTPHMRDVRDLAR
jgi:hypothetical protein